MQSQQRFSQTHCCSNTSLTEINLFLNNVGERGGLALARLMQLNTTLRTVNLLANDLVDENRNASTAQIALQAAAEQAAKYLPFKHTVFYSVW